MSIHLTFQQTTVVRRSVHEVFGFLCDVDRAHEWRAGVVESFAIPRGPVHSGSIRYEVATVLGRPIVTETIVDTVEAPHRLTFSHLNGALPVSGEYTCRATPLGTEVTYRATVELRGRWTMFAASLRRFENRNITRSLATLRATLDTEALVGAVGRG